MKDYVKVIESEIQFLNELKQDLLSGEFDLDLISTINCQLDKLTKSIETNINTFKYKQYTAEWYYSPHDSYYWGRFYNEEYIPLIFKGKTRLEAENNFHKMVDEI